MSNLTRYQQVESSDAVLIAESYWVYLVIENDFKHLPCTIRTKIDWSLKQDLTSGIELNYDSNHQTIGQNR
jgi:hypothetical protein